MRAPMKIYGVSDGSVSITITKAASGAVNLLLHLVMENEVEVHRSANSFDTTRPTLLCPHLGG